MIKQNFTEIDNGVKEYFKSLKSFKSLRKSEERALLKDYLENGNLSSRNKLINSNLKYACTLANSYRGRGVDFSELISEANSGLIESIDKFDTKQNVKLITYAKWWIMQRLNAYIANKYKHSGDELPTDHQEQTCDDDENISDKTNNTSYEQFVTDEIDSEKNNADKKRFIYSLLENLDEREREIIELYFGLDGSYNTLETIGDMYGITKERTRQIIEKTLIKLRSYAMLVE